MTAERVPSERADSPRYTGPEDYAKKNPLGGVARVFDTIADRLRTGEDYYEVLRDYDLQPIPAATEPTEARPTPSMDALFDGSDAHLLAGPTGENAVSAAEALTAAGGSPAFKEWCALYYGEAFPVDIGRIETAFYGGRATLEREAADLREKCRAEWDARIVAEREREALGIVLNLCMEALPECQAWGDLPGHIAALQARLDAPVPEVEAVALRPFDFVKVAGRETQCVPADLARDLARRLAEAQSHIELITGWNEAMVARIQGMVAERESPAPVAAEPVAWIGTRIAPSGEVDHSTVKDERYKLIDFGYMDSEIQPLYTRPASANESHD